MEYSECLDAIERLGHEIRGVKFDLQTIDRLLTALGKPHLRYPAAIIAGTNGKGSTSAMLAAVLDLAGYATGLYTSPHLARVNERVRSRGREISNDDFAAAFTAVHHAADDLSRNGGLSRSPSYFELLTALAFWHFAEAAIDIAVLEVGMGGRLDATNVINPAVSVITNVSLDHQQFLGDTVEAIAGEKAGIIKPGRPVISGCEDEGARGVIRRRCEETGSELLEIGSDVRLANVRDCKGQFLFDLRFRGQRLRNLAPALAGRFQVKNAALAAAAAMVLRQRSFDIPDDAIRAGLAGVRWPGRIEAIHERPLVLLDGAHNPAAAVELAAYIRDEFGGRRVLLVYASMRDKAIEEISGALFPLADCIYLTTLPMARAATPREILDRSGLASFRAVVEPDPLRAVAEACRASSSDDVVLVAGSLFLVGAIERARGDGTLILDAGRPSPDPVEELEYGGPSSRG